MNLAEYPQVFYPWLRWQDTAGDVNNIRNLDFYLQRNSGDVDLQDLTLMSPEAAAAFNRSVVKDLIEIRTGGAMSGKVNQLRVPFPLEVTSAFGVRPAGTHWP